ncbi:hypothetical protein BZA77DRAFT_387866 [Pyronema omphalodes]|nr:hypothetical protein BZA77DRAFT_387866 [Pyronema omphalodes]
MVDCSSDHSMVVMQDHEMDRRLALEVCSSRLGRSSRGIVGFSKEAFKTYIQNGFGTIVGWLVSVLGFT